MLCIRLTSLNAMRIKISFALAYDSISMFPAPTPPCPTDLDRFPGPLRRFLALPLPAPPRPVKKSLPAHPCPQPTRLWWWGKW